jgi:hypothetical protein
MRLRVLLTALILALTGLVPLGAAATASTGSGDGARHACTKRADGHCIKRGQRCAQTKRGQIGWTKAGVKVRCKGHGKHPHWRKVHKSRHYCRAAGCAIPAPACTTNSDGTCIQTGQSCSPDQYGQSGNDANGKLLTCQGEQSDPTWGAPPA